MASFSRVSHFHIRSTSYHATSYLFLNIGVCPSNFDPIGLDSNPNRRSVRLEIGAREGKLTGKYGFEFGGSEVYFSADSTTFTGTKCVEALKVTINEAANSIIQNLVSQTYCNFCFCFYIYVSIYVSISVTITAAGLEVCE